MHARTYTHRRHCRTGYRYSLGPNRDGPLRWRQCWSLAIEINMATRFHRGCVFSLIKKLLGRTEIRTCAGCTVRRYKQLETSPETIEQELLPAVCEHRQTDRQTDLRRIIVDIILPCLGPFNSFAGSHGSVMIY